MSHASLGDGDARHVFAREALAQIPKILTLQDRNAHSPTYGCFDRNFWHYKIIDFPSGMAQEFVWPLALAYTLPLEGNSYHQQPAIREWIEAGILYAARSAHPDGSCDDYFPFEKAAGAAAFTLLACLESYSLLGLQNQEMLDFFAKRASWLADHHESGRLTNHQALIVLCLEKVARLLGTDRWEPLRAKRLARVLEWQNDEGWFQEYEGCDPGYHTLTIALLAQVYELTPSEQLCLALEKAIRFAANFVHPDGSFGGEYTSRNTYNFFPHGFEIAGKWLPEALEINDRFLVGLRQGLGSCYADDHILGHHTWSYLLAFQHFVSERPAHAARPGGRLHFKNAGIIIERRGNAELYLALNKGGVLKYFVDGKLVHSDTHFSAQVQDGKLRNAVGHLVGSYKTQLEADKVMVSGRLGWAKTKQMTTFNLVVLRFLMLSVGRFFPDLIRKLLQRILITGKKPAPLEFTRAVHWAGERLRISDELSTNDWSRVHSVGIGASQTSIYVVMSRTYQAGQLQPWLDLTPKVRALKAGEALRVEREFP
ncbi:MAG TPA: hypothetical protein VF614_14095 [Chthoniobacteraceae bacterium]|jgi:hypothetical protein